MTIDTNPQTIVDTFNTEHGSVTWVRYWTGTRDDAPKYDLTNGKAWLLGGHTPVVRLRGEPSCIALTHVDVLPGQPGDIADDSRDLPDPVDAAQRVKEYISATGDGIYDVVDGNPLYARDLEALRRATERASEVEMCAEKTQIDLEKARAELAGLTAANQRLLNRLHAATPDLVTAQRRADQAEDRAADLANRLHRAEQEIASHNKAVTHWASEVAAKDKVIDAAKEWRRHYGNTSDAFGNACTALAATVDALPATADQAGCPYVKHDGILRYRCGAVGVCEEHGHAEQLAVKAGVA